MRLSSRGIIIKSEYRIDAKSRLKKNHKNKRAVINSPFTFIDLIFYVNNGIFYFLTFAFSAAFR